MWFVAILSRKTSPKLVSEHGLTVAENWNEHKLLSWIDRNSVGGLERLRHTDLTLPISEIRIRISVVAVGLISYDAVFKDGVFTLSHCTELILFKEFGGPIVEPGYTSRGGGGSGEKVFSFCINKR